MKKKFSRLVVPYLVSMGLLIMWSCIPALCKHDWHMPVRHLLSMAWGGNTSLWHATFCDYYDGIRISHIWFCLALFWGSIILFGLSKWPKYVLICGFVISFSAYMLFPYCNDFVPWTILPGLGALQFLAIGHWLRDHKLPTWFWLICVGCSIFVVKCFGFSMWNVHYTCYPIDVLGALGGTYCFYWLCFGISKLRISRKVFVYLGQISLAILCFHTIEPLSDIMNSIRIRLMPLIEFNEFGWVMIRYSVVIAVAILSAKIPILKKVYSA